MNELNVDSATLQVVLEMQLEDLETISGASKGKQRQGEVCDFELALDSYRSEVESQLFLLHDRNICKSIASAVRLDADILNEHIAQEAQASFDRDLALKSTGRVMPTGLTPKQATSAPEAAADLLNRLEALYVSPPDVLDGSSCQPESSSWAAARREPYISRSCTACTDDFPIHNLACGSGCSHEYCRKCLRKLFSDALTDESLFPPRCCGNTIDLEAVMDFLPPKMVGEFRAKSLELETSNRTYCHQPTCSRFLPPAAISGEVGRCIRCHRETCVICKGPAHSERECPEDTATQALLDTAAEHGWQRCYQCHRIVELNFGCYHISTYLWDIPIL